MQGTLQNISRHLVVCLPYIAGHVTEYLQTFSGVSALHCRARYRISPDSYQCVSPTQQNTLQIISIQLPVCLPYIAEHVTEYLQTVTSVSAVHCRTRYRIFPDSYQCVWNALQSTLQNISRQLPVCLECIAEHVTEYLQTVTSVFGMHCRTRYRISPDSYQCVWNALQSTLQNISRQLPVCLECIAEHVTEYLQTVTSVFGMHCRARYRISPDSYQCVWNALQSTLQIISRLLPVCLECIAEYVTEYLKTVTSVFGIHCRARYRISQDCYQCVWNALQSTLQNISRLLPVCLECIAEHVPEYLEQDTYQCAFYALQSTLHNTSRYLAVYLPYIAEHVTEYLKTVTSVFGTHCRARYRISQDYYKCVWNALQSTLQNISRQLQMCLEYIAEHVTEYLQTVTNVFGMHCRARYRISQDSYKCVWNTLQSTLQNISRQLQMCLECIAEHVTEYLKTVTSVF